MVYGLKWEWGKEGLRAGGSMDTPLESKHPREHVWPPHGHGKLPARECPIDPLTIKVHCRTLACGE